MIRGTLSTAMNTRIFRTSSLLLSVIVLSQLFVSAESVLQTSSALMLPTSSAVCLSLAHSMSIGSRDTSTEGEVTVLQTFLADKGYLLSEPTGYFGSLTKKAVVDFQKANKVDPIGLVGPSTRATLKKVSCSTSGKSQEKAPLVLGSFGSIIATPPVIVTPVKTALAPFKLYVNDSIQVDASSVPKEFATDMCKKFVTSNASASVRCMWNGVDIQETTTASIGASPVTVPPVYMGAPFVKLIVSPITVPYKGGYDSFELTSEKMTSCTLYFKDEPSAHWISGGSSLGVNFKLPGYKGMEKSRSYYASCSSVSGQIVNSETVLISVSATQ